MRLSLSHGRAEERIGINPESGWLAVAGARGGVAAGAGGRRVLPASCGCAPLAGSLPPRAMLLVFRLCLLLLCAAPAAALALPANKPTPGYARVAIETSVGTIIVAVDLKRAPRTSANFLTYVDDGRFDGVTFYRAARRKSNARLGLIQGGIDTDLRRSLPPIPHEPTSKTGLRGETYIGGADLLRVRPDARPDDRQAHHHPPRAPPGWPADPVARAQAVAAGAEADSEIDRFRQRPPDRAARRGRLRAGGGPALSSMPVRGRRRPPR